MKPGIKLNINCFILNGGKSSRMKKDKAKIAINGQSFLDRIIDEIAPVFKKCFLVGKEYQHPLSAGWFKDRIEGIGPIGGLYTALLNTDTDKNFIIALDYPLVDKNLVYSFLEKADKFMKKYDGIIPIHKDGPHPLFGIYQKSCIGAVEECIKNNRFSIMEISNYCNILFIEISKLLPQNTKTYLEKSFINVNTPEDYKKLLKTLGN